MTETEKGKVDPRFDPRRDPRFRKLRTSKKEPPNSRFEELLQTDARFGGPPVDKYGRRLREESDSSSESSESEEETSDSESEAEPPLTDESSSRIALMGLNWDLIAAADILVMLRSLAGEDAVSSVAIYPSDFGLASLAEEAKAGPQLVTKRARKKHDDRGGEYDDSGDEAVQAAYRRYARKRSKYFYAVAECSTSETASSLYESLQDVNTDAAPLGMDVRLVPEGLQFPHKPKSSASEVVKGTFEPRTMSAGNMHSKVRCAWDETDPNRSRMLKKKFSAKEMKAMDLQQYLASDSDSGDENAPQIPEFLKEKLAESGRSFQAPEERHTAAEEAVAAMRSLIVGAKPAQDRSKRAQGRRDFNQEISVGKPAVEEAAEIPERNPKVGVKQVPQKRSKRAKSHLPSRGEEDTDGSAAAALGLLVAEKDSRDFFHRKKKKSTPADDFQVNLEDDRLRSLFEKPDMALDPTCPQYKRSVANEAIAKKRRAKTGERKGC